LPHDIARFAWIRIGLMTVRVFVVVTALVALKVAGVL
jgi:hypothetical protein